ncbi:MAG TPA: hypothetical protein VGM77_06895 [Gemmatimonadales bacterium]|jgi:hypothetical protein
MPDGAIAVGQAEDHRIRFFDATGRDAGSFGRLGAGPGEFRSVGLAGMIGDTLWVSDGQNYRITYIGPDHKLVRSERLTPAIKANSADEHPLPSGSSAGLIPLGRYPDGTVLTDIRAPTNQPRPAWFPPDALGAVWVRVSTDGLFRKIIAIGPPPRQDCRFSGTAGPFHATGSVPFCDPSMRQVAGDGSRIAFVIGNAVAGSPMTYRVLVIATTGDTLFTRTYDYRPVAIPKRVIDSVIAFVARTVPDEAALFRQMPFPANYPPVLRLFNGVDRTMWVEEPATTPGHHWRVLDAKGEPVGTLIVPGSVELVAATRHLAWGIDTDADGLQSIVQWRIGD